VSSQGKIRRTLDFPRSRETRERNTRPAEAEAGKEHASRKGKALYSDPRERPLSPKDAAQKKRSRLRKTRASMARGGETSAQGKVPSSKKSDARLRKCLEKGLIRFHRNDSHGRVGGLARKPEEGCTAAVNRKPCRVRGEKRKRRLMFRRVLGLQGGRRCKEQVISWRERKAASTAAC